MKLQNGIRIVLAGSISAMLFSAPASFAQSIWLPRTEKHTVSVEFLKPDFDGDVNADFFTSALFLTGKLRVSEKLFLVAELPFARRGFDEEPRFADSQTAIGNPYFGVETRGASTFFEFGVRPPIMSEDDFLAASVGFVADDDRFEAFESDVFTVAAKANYLKKNASNVMARLRFGPALFIYTNETGDDADLALDYSVQVGHEGGLLHVIGGVTGRYFATSDDGDFGQRSIHQFGVAADLVRNTIRPGVHLRIPLDEDLRNGIDWVFGLHLTALLR